MAKAVAKRKATTSKGRKSTVRAVAKKAVRKTAAPVSTRKAPAKKAAAPKKAARTNLRVVAADGQTVRTSADRIKSLASQVSVDADNPVRLLPMVITDYSELRIAMIRAMGGDVEAAAAEDIVQVEGVNVVRGSHATKAEGTKVSEDIRRQRKGPQTIVRVHPLDFHVLTGEDQHNFRDFTTARMKRRVAELAADVAVNGVRDPLKAAIRANLLIGMGGETRWRATAHAWVFKQHGLLSTAPERIPVALSRRTTNDADTALDVLKDNEVENLQPIEIARGLAKSENLGKSTKDIAIYMGKSEDWVKSMIAMTGMPERVQIMIRSGECTVSLAWKAWEMEGHDPNKTIRAIASAQNMARALSVKVGPRHLTPSTPRPTEETTTTKERGGESGSTRTTTTTRPARQSSSAQDTATITKLRNLLDQTSGALSSSNRTRTGDGFVLIRIKEEDFEAILHTKLGVPLPEADESDGELDLGEDRVVPPSASAEAGQGDQPEIEDQPDQPNVDEPVRESVMAD